MNEKGLESVSSVTVVGGGVTGRAVIETLNRIVSRLFVTDHGEINRENREFFRRTGINFEEGGHTKRALESDLMVASPGVPPGSELIQKASSLGIKIIGEIELADLLSPSDKTIAVTGTNGKTTTVKLIESLLNHAGKRAFACGNIGKPYIEVVPSLTASDIPVVEVSSYQLEYTSQFSPEVAVLLNLEPDHLSRHGSFENYRDAKLKIFSKQGKGDFAVLNADLDVEPLPGEAEVVKFERKNIQRIDLPPHQQENLGAATKAASCILKNGSLLASPPGIIENAFEVPHRQEKVSEINGRKIINDSKATNPAATVAALSTFTEPIHLLLGGRAKNSGYEELAGEMKRSSVKAAYLFGAARDELTEVLRTVDFEAFTAFPSMKRATRAAIQNSRRGDIVLLSPACSSFDAFSSFEERGAEFSRIVEELT